jgi:hypothetical protein
MVTNSTMSPYAPTVAGPLVAHNEKNVCDWLYAYRHTFLAWPIQHFVLVYDEEIEMEPRPQAQGVTYSALRIGSPSGRRMGRRSIGFEGVPERTPTRREGVIAKGSNGRSQRRENIEVNLPPLLAAHLGRTEAGVPLQPSHASGVEGNPPPFNVGGNLPPNGMYPQIIALCWYK